MADVIFAQDPVSVGFPAFLAARLLGKKYVVKIVGDYAWEQYSQKSKVKNQKFVTLEEFQEKRFDFMTEMRRWAERFVSCHADTVIVPSNYLKTIVLGWGVHPQKINVIYNSFDLPVTVSHKDDIRRRLGLNGTILVSAGRLVPWKGFEALIDVVAELKDKIPDLRLYIMGDGPEHDTLELRIKNYKLNNTVFLLGRLSQKSLFDYIQSADVFVLNTGYEGFSHQLLEVAALGTPIVTTNVGGNRELIENQHTGLLVSYNDTQEIKKAIELLITNQELRDRLIKNGKEKVKLFSHEHMLRSLIKALG